MTEDLGVCTGIQFKVESTPVISKLFHRGFKGKLSFDDGGYSIKIKSRYTKNGEITIKADID